MLQESEAEITDDYVDLEETNEDPSENEVPSEDEFILVEVPKNIEPGILVSITTPTPITKVKDQDPPDTNIPKREPTQNSVTPAPSDPETPSASNKKSSYSDILRKAEMKSKEKSVAEKSNLSVPTKKEHQFSSKNTSRYHTRPRGRGDTSKNWHNNKNSSTTTHRYRGTFHPEKSQTSEPVQPASKPFKMEMTS